MELFPGSFNEKLCEQLLVSCHWDGGVVHYILTRNIITGDIRDKDGSRRWQGEKGGETNKNHIPILQNGQTKEQLLCAVIVYRRFDLVPKGIIF